MNPLVWTPSPDEAARAEITRFAHRLRARGLVPSSDPHVLWSWSVERPERFWAEAASFFAVPFDTRPRRVLEDPDAMPGARWFVGAELNYARALLEPGAEDDPALVFRDEGGGRRTWTRGDLRRHVAGWQDLYRALGLTRGERVAGYLPNLPETLAAMLAAAAGGLVWAGASSDFGVEGVLDRFGQVAPRLLIAADGYRHQGRQYDVRERVVEIARRLDCPTVLVPYLRPEESPPAGMRPPPPPAEGSPVFTPVPFDHPLYVLFSSGTTGRPKGIVHAHGRVLLQHLKEHRLHVDLRAGERLFYYTTIGWMMWNWLVSALASRAVVVLYEGSPFHPGPEALLALAREEGVTHFGTSAKYLSGLEKAGVDARASGAFDGTRTILSTGSPLLPEQFDYVHDALGPHLHLASISGGTDIVSCFVLGHPLLPVHRGEIQCRGLGMPVDVFDEAGRPLRGRPGELVATRPFLAMPVGFWNDPDGARYRETYFATYPGVWRHGDRAEITASGGLVLSGRSDAVLNPGGVRIGTAEIYRQVEVFPEVLEALAVGRRVEGDERIVLFLRLREGCVLDENLRQAIRRRLREQASPRHVPDRILAVADFPRTRSGKISEIAVREVLAGGTPANTGALANPEVLDLFRGFDELRSKKRG